MEDTGDIRDKDDRNKDMMEKSALDLLLDRFNQVEERMIEKFQKMEKRMDKIENEGSETQKVQESQSGSDESRLSDNTNSACDTSDS